MYVFFIITVLLALSAVVARSAVVALLAVGSLKPILAAVRLEVAQGTYSIQ
jgi:hypothetical protein